jgi:hypothetical protein
MESKQHVRCALVHGPVAQNASFEPFPFITLDLLKAPDEIDFLGELERIAGQRLAADATQGRDVARAMCLADRVCPRSGQITHGVAFVSPII